MVQTVNIAPKLSVETDGQWGTIPDIISTQTYNNTQATIDWKYSNLQTIEALMMDVTPTVDPLLFDPSLLYPIDFWYNDTGKNQGKVYGATLLFNGNASAISSNGDLNTPRKEAATFVFLREIRLKGAQIQYTRFVKSPAVTTTFDVAFVGSAGTYPTAVAAVNGPSQYVLAAKWLTGGIVTPILDPTTFSTYFSSNTTTFTVVTAPVNGDAWEVWTAIVPA
jgi:hypothetical protein